MPMYEIRVRVSAATRKEAIAATIIPDRVEGGVAFVGNVDEGYGQEEKVFLTPSSADDS